MGSGALFAMTTGTVMMQLLYVDSWDSQHQVSYMFDSARLVWQLP